MHRPTLCGVIKLTRRVKISDPKRQVKAQNAAIAVSDELGECDRRAP
jgi:hypothetical protein